MKPADVERLLMMFGSSKLSWRGGKLHGTCPLARWKHSGGTDSHPSFAVYRTANGGLRFKCLSCASRGTLRGLYWQVARKSGDWMQDANFLVYEKLMDGDPPTERIQYRVGGPSVGPPELKKIEPRGVGEHGAVKMPSGKTELLWEDMTFHGKTAAYDLPGEDVFNRWRAGPMPEYVRDRGVAEGLYRLWGLGYDEKRRRWIFPCHARDGEIVGYTGRLCWDKSYCYRCGTDIVDKERSARKGELVLMSHCPRCKTSHVKYWHVPGPWKRSAAYGIHLYKDGGPIAVVEGSTDVIQLWKLMVRFPMGIFGGSPNPIQVKMICELGGDIYLMGDGDKAGKIMNETFAMMASGFGRKTIEVPLPDGLDPGKLTEDTVRGIVPKELLI